MDAKKALGAGLWVALAVIGAVFVYGVWSAQTDKKPSDKVESAAAPQAPAAAPVDAAPAVDAAAGQVLAVDAGTPVKVTARQLFADYDANEVSADAKYRGKLIEVTGIVTKIGKDVLDKPVVVLAGKNEFSDVIAGFGSDVDVIKLKKGYKLVAQCRGVGMTLGSPGLNECVVEHIYEWVRH